MLIIYSQRYAFVLGKLQHRLAIVIECTRANTLWGNFTIDINMEATIGHALQYMIDLDSPMHYQ